MKRFAGAAVVLGLLGLVAAFVLWWLPADDFLFVPDRAKPLADKVEVEGGKAECGGRRLLRRPLRASDPPARAAPAVHATGRLDARLRGGSRSDRRVRRGAQPAERCGHGALGGDRRRRRAARARLRRRCDAARRSRDHGVARRAGGGHPRPRRRDRRRRRNTGQDARTSSAPRSAAGSPATTSA